MCPGKQVAVGIEDHLPLKMSEKKRKRANDAARQLHTKKAALEASAETITISLLESEKQWMPVLSRLPHICCLNLTEEIRSFHTRPVSLPWGLLQTLQKNPFDCPRSPPSLAGPSKAGLHRPRRKFQWLRRPPQRLHWGL